MIRAPFLSTLSLSAALALLPFSTAMAEETPSIDNARFEAAAEAFGARMADFGARAEAIGGDQTLGELEREVRIAAVWAEYQPEVSAFTSAATVFAASAAAEALAEIDVDALVAEAMANVDLQETLAMASGVVANSAWTNPDEEQMVTYGLVAQYGLNEGLSETRDDADDATD